jgi:Na+-transporting NADH:ubiquinone oxidoreductase subunit NqrD
MSKRQETPLILSSRSPLSSLSGAVLLIGGTGRLAHAFVLGAAVFAVYVAVPLLLKLAGPVVPSSYRTWVRVLVASTAAAVFSRVAGMVWPPLVHELALYLGMVPLCLISSGLIDRVETVGRLDALKDSLLEAAVLCGLALAFALVREPFGFGMLSIPGSDGITPLFSREGAAAASLRSASATAGGFMILGYLIAVHRKVRFRVVGEPPCGEGDR